MVQRINVIHHVTPLPIVAAVLLIYVIPARGLIGDEPPAGEIHPKPRAEVVNAFDFGFDPVDSTRALQRAINTGAKRVIVPNVGADWVLQPIELAVDDQEVIFEPGVVVTARKNAFHGRQDCLFSISRRKNVTMRGYGAVLQMLKDDYTRGIYQRSEFRHCVKVQGSHGVQILGFTIRRSGGDGIYIGPTGNEKFSSNVLIRDVICDDHFRQGISVTSARNLRIENCILRNTRGTDPMAGIDFEPYRPEHCLVNCRLVNCLLTNNNEDRGGLTSLTRLDATSEDVSITFERCHTIGNLQPVAVCNVAPDGPAGKMSFLDCTFTAPWDHGVRLKNLSGRVRTCFERCQWQETQYPIVIRTNHEAGQVTGGFEFIDCVVNESLDRPLIWYRPELVDQMLFDLQGNFTVFNPHGVRLEWDGMTKGIHLEIEEQRTTAPVVALELSHESIADPLESILELKATANDPDVGPEDGAGIEEVRFVAWRDGRIAAALSDAQPPYTAQFITADWPAGVYLIEAQAYGEDSSRTVAVKPVTVQMGDTADRGEWNVGFPLLMDDNIPQERVVEIDVEKPASATHARLVIAAFDADTNREGALYVNGAGPLELFGKRASGRNNARTVEVEYETPAEWWRNGSNSLRFSHTHSMGYRVENVTVTFPSDDDR